MTVWEIFDVYKKVATVGSISEYQNGSGEAEWIISWQRGLA